MEHTIIFYVTNQTMVDNDADRISFCCGLVKQLINNVSGTVNVTQSPTGICLVAEYNNLISYDDSVKMFNELVQLVHDTLYQMGISTQFNSPA